MAKKSKKTAVKKKATKEKKSVSSPKKSAHAVSKKKAKTVKRGKKTTKTLSKTAEKPASNSVKSASEKGSKSVKKRRKIRTQLKKQDLIHFRDLLMNKLQEILGDVDWIENEALRKSRQDSTGDLSTMPIHMADLGTDNYEQEFSLGLMDSERKLVQEILAALKRISLGTYGICEGTGEPIPRARLEANPWARYCVEYASLIEQGKAGEGQYRNMYFDNNSEDEEDHEGGMEGLEQEEETEEDDLFYKDDEEEEEDEEESEDDTYAEGFYYEDDPDEEDDEVF